ncbi:hypothetical protein H6776_02675 [Candidatus Nomurabacteria bacterium]|nr:hypothetical protein [Candidatus Nomurabacteria bacterium]
MSFETPNFTNNNEADTTENAEMSNDTTPETSQEIEFMTMPDGTLMDVTNMSPAERREAMESYHENNNEG